MAEGKTVVAAPLIAELSAPRFLAGGDRTSLALDLANLSGRAQQLNVEISTEGQLSLAANAVQNVALAEGQRSTLMIPVQAQGGLGRGRYMCGLLACSCRTSRPARSNASGRWRAPGLPGDAQALPRGLEGPAMDPA